MSIVGAAGRSSLHLGLPPETGGLPPESHSRRAGHLRASLKNASLDTSRHASPPGGAAGGECPWLHKGQGMPSHAHESGLLVDDLIRGMRSSHRRHPPSAPLEGGLRGTISLPPHPLGYGRMYPAAHSTTHRYIAFQLRCGTDAHKHELHRARIALGACPLRCTKDRESPTVPLWGTIGGRKK